MEKAIVGMGVVRSSYVGTVRAMSLTSVVMLVSPVDSFTGFRAGQWDARTKNSHQKFL